MLTEATKLGACSLNNAHGTLHQLMLFSVISRSLKTWTVDYGLDHGLFPRQKIAPLNDMLVLPPV